MRSTRKVFCVERDAIIGLLRQNLPKGHQHRLRLGTAKAQKVEITRAAVRIVKPTHHQHRTLQHKTARMG
ncbi:hypothetical protein RLEG12_09015 (plasmid) [Rhizobium leguminosarum bv. trifolii CB782]|nr:hypothetical protein RLEG12_09015 [Rhizobium leguminosarum bv. trifolii CB782]